MVSRLLRIGTLGRPFRQITFQTIDSTSLRVRTYKELIVGNQVLCRILCCIWATSSTSLEPIAKRFRKICEEKIEREKRCASSTDRAGIAKACRIGRHRHQPRTMSGLPDKRLSRSADGNKRNRALLRDDSDQRSDLMEVQTVLLDLRRPKKPIPSRPAPKSAIVPGSGTSTSTSPITGP